MLARRLEPEIMDTAEDARDYDGMDHRAVNRLFVQDFLAFAGQHSPTFSRRCEGRSPCLLDVGTGTAQIPIELLRHDAACEVIAIDLAEEMLKLARRNIERAGFQAAIRVELADAKHLPYSNGRFDAVISNSIVHHIPQPLDVLAEMVRVLKPGAPLFVRDLLRPQTTDELDRLVATYAGQENAHSQQLFRDSLHAALSLAELRELAESLLIPDSAIAQTSDRHWTLAWVTPGIENPLPVPGSPQN
jgi:SAM-dependent methyltransferase